MFVPEKLPAPGIAGEHLLWDMARRLMYRTVLSLAVLPRFPGQALYSGVESKIGRTG